MCYYLSVYFIFDLIAKENNFRLHKCNKGEIFKNNRVIGRKREKKRGFQIWRFTVKQYGEDPRKRNPKKPQSILSDSEHNRTTISRRCWAFQRFKNL
jgi:hypothetical protein